MTIAAGILHNQGLLLFSDTELTAGDLKLHAAKDARVDCPWGRIGMVCAGHFYNAQSTMQHIARGVNRLPASEHPFETIEKVLDREYRRIVWTNPDRQFGDHLEFWLIIGIQRNGSGRPELYVSDRNTLRASNGYECVGSGSVIASQMIHTGYTAIVSAETTAILAAYVMSAAKRHASGVGGMSMMMDLGNDGTLTQWMDDSYLKTLEDYFGVFQLRTWNLAVSMMQSSLTDEDFGINLQIFNELVVQDRQKWHALRQKHEDTRKAYLDLTRPKAKPVPQSPKRDRKARRPSLG